MSQALARMQTMNPLIMMAGVYAAVILVCSLSIAVGFWSRRRSLYICVCQLQKLGTSAPKVIVQIIVFLCIMGATVIMHIASFCYSYNTKGMAKGIPLWLGLLLQISFGHSHIVLIFPFVFYVVFGKIIYHHFETLNNALEKYLSSDIFLQMERGKKRPTPSTAVRLEDVYSHYVELRYLYEELWGAVSFPVLANNVFTFTYCISLVFRIIAFSTMGIGYEASVFIIVSTILGLTIYCQGHVADMVNTKVRTAF